MLLALLRGFKFPKSRQTGANAFDDKPVRRRWTTANALPRYLVEEVTGGVVVKSHFVITTTPEIAASLATGKSVTVRTSETRWIRVIENGRTTFEFAHSEQERRLPAG